MTLWKNDSNGDGLDCSHIFWSLQWSSPRFVIMVCMVKSGKLLDMWCGSWSESSMYPGLSRMLSHGQKNAKLGILLTKPVFTPKGNSWVKKEDTMWPSNPSREIQRIFKWFFPCNPAPSIATKTFGVMPPPPRFSSLAEFPSLWNANIPKHLEMFPWVWKWVAKNSRKASVSRTMEIFHYCQNVP